LVHERSGREEMQMTNTILGVFCPLINVSLVLICLYAVLMDPSTLGLMDYMACFSTCTPSLPGKQLSRRTTFTRHELGCNSWTSPKCPCPKRALPFLGRTQPACYV
jgi:hypothetical protein